MDSTATTPWVALFRGLNVGGSGVLPMKDLVAILESQGAEDVRTYIQSGNAVFRCAEPAVALLAEHVRAEIGRRHGFLPQVLVLAPAALERAMQRNPFPEAQADPASLHLGFLAAVPQAPDLEGLERLRKPSERFLLDGQVFYLHAPEGVGRSRLAAASEKLLGVPLTDRNWKTACKIREMACI